MNKCKGCGIKLQTKNKELEGYTKNQDNEYCERCFRIKHYNEYKTITKNNDYYINLLKKEIKPNDLVLIVCDFLNTIDLKIKNKTILVLTKRDIIPRSLDENKLLNRIANNKYNEKIIVSSKNNYNLDELMNKIKKQNISRVFVVGYTSSGKSTLINKLITNYTPNNPYITTSSIPSTTLDLIEINICGIVFIDTPGLLDQGSIILKANKDLLDKIIPKKEIKPIVLQIKQKQTIIVDNCFRLDVLNQTTLVFYMSNNLKIHRHFKDIDYYKDKKIYNEKLKEAQDIVIKGLGFIKTTKPCDIVLYLDKDITYTKRQSII